MINEATGIIKLTHRRNPHQGEKLQPEYHLPKTQKRLSLVAVNLLEDDFL